MSVDKIKKCSECGVTIILTSNRQKYCVDCKVRIKKEKTKQWFIDNKEKRPKYSIDYYKKNKQKILEKERIYRKNNKELKAVYEKCRYKRDIVKRKALCKKWREQHKEYDKQKNKEYRKKNKEKINKQHKEYYHKNCFSTQFKLKRSVSALIRSKLYRRLLSKNRKSTWDFLPYTIEELMIHLEKLFQPSMTWENYGKWHIDHKKPDSLFNYKSVDDEEFQKCWALKNLQPLWAKDNIKKGNKYNHMNM